MHMCIDVYLCVCMNLVDFINRGTPMWTAKCYGPYYWDPQNIGEAPESSSLRGCKGPSANMGPGAH